MKIHIYILLDFGGNVELEKSMTETEAKEANEKLLEGERFIRWVRKYSDRQEEKI